MNAYFISYFLSAWDGYPISKGIVSV